MSNFSPQDNKNSEHNVFSGIPTRLDQDDLFSEFLSEQDLTKGTINAMVFDIRKFAKWFASSNQEPWDTERVTVRDIIDFREYLRVEKKQAASTINRNLSTIRKYFKWLFSKDYIPVNPAMSVKEVKRL
jgi:site-specific recombinase XerD